MNQSQPMTRLEVVDIETLEVKKAIYLAGHNAQEIQAMSDSLLRNLNTFQFFVRATPSAAPVALEAPRYEWLKDIPAEHVVLLAGERAVQGD